MNVLLYHLHLTCSWCLGMHLHLVSLAGGDVQIVSVIKNRQIMQQCQLNKHIASYITLQMWTITIIVVSIYSGFVIISVWWSY